MLSGRVTDKMVFVAIYTLVAILVVVQGGRHITNYVLDTVFYNDYLMAWKMQLTTMRHQAIDWPPYVAHDPGSYMDRLNMTMRANGLAPPKSNTEQSYFYRLNKFGEKAQQILIVGLSEKIIIYNLPSGTYDRLDHYVDGRTDASSGAFTAQRSVDGITRIGYWRY